MKGKRRKSSEEGIEGTYGSLKDLYGYATLMGKKNNDISQKFVFSQNTTPTARLSDILKSMHNEHQ